MNLKDIFGDLKDLAMPWRMSGSEWKDKVKNAEIGSPIHGLRAGYEMSKLGSAYRGRQSLGRIRDGQNPLSGEFIRGTAGDQWSNLGDAFRENWPVIASFAAGAGGLGGGGGAGGAGGAGGVAAGGGGAAGAGAGGAGLGIDAAGGLTAAGAPGSTALGAGNAAYATGSGVGGFSLGGLAQGLGQVGGLIGGGQQQAPQQQQMPMQAPPVTPIAAANPQVTSRGARGLGMNGQIDPQLLALLQRMAPASGGYV